MNETPLDLIEKGIVTSDMDLIAKGYQYLTGKTVTPERNNIDSSPSLLNNETKTDVVKTEPVKNFEAPIRNSSDKTYARKSPFIPGGFKNSFVDNGKECLQEKTWDKEHPMQVSERNRTAARIVRVKCRICGVEEEISENLAPVSLGGEKSGYRCNSCCGGK